MLVKGALGKYINTNRHAQKSVELNNLCHIELIHVS